MRRGVVLGMVVAVAVAVGVVVRAAGDGDTRAAITGAEAAREFLAAWEASRQGTYVVEGTFERSAASGGVLRSDVYLAQRPPDRLHIQFGSVSGSIDGRQVACSSAQLDQFPCTSGAPAADFAADVAADVGRLREYVGPGAPLYGVVGDGDGCFELSLRDPGFPSPPYGTSARFCFDGATGAQTEIRIERVEATDRTVARVVRRTVTDADFRLPADPDAAGRFEADPG